MIITMDLKCLDDKPKTCMECPMMRCGKCVPVGSRSITDYPYWKLKRPDWCPIRYTLEELLHEVYFSPDSPYKMVEVKRNESSC